MLQTISTDIVADVVIPLCDGCFAEPVATDYGLGADCADFQLGSDLFKDEHGFRPRFEGARESIIAWVRGEASNPWGAW